MTKPKRQPATQAGEPSAGAEGDAGSGAPTVVPEPPLDRHWQERAQLERFDPFTATIEDIKALPVELQLGSRGATQKWMVAQDILNRREHYESTAVLEAIRSCLVEDVAPPPWLFKAFMRKYEDALQKNSWDAAFGHPLPKRADIRTLRQREQKKWELWFFFDRPDAPPRNREGFAAAAKALGLTVNQVEEWTPKTRVNRRGHKPYHAAVKDRSLALSDPFGRIQPPPKIRPKR